VAQPRDVLMAAFDEMARLKDEYVSTEHLLRHHRQEKGEAARMLQQAGHPEKVYSTLERSGQSARDRRQPREKYDA